MIAVELLGPSGAPIAALFLTSAAFFAVLAVVWARTQDNKEAR